MYILIDDTRILDADIIISNYESAQFFFGKLGCHLINTVIPITVGIDHDLGGEKTGYDLLKWVFKNKLYPEKIELVTMNPVGRENMANLLLSAGYNSVDNINFIKE